MIELTRTCDPVFLTWLRARLDEEGIEAFVFDDRTAGAFACVLDAILARVMVDEADLARAQAILEDKP